MADAPKQPLHMEGGHDGTVHCYLCPHHCSITPGDTGRCGVRGNSDGVPSVPLHGLISGIELLPVEAFGFYHFLPGRNVQSASMVGCTLETEKCGPWAARSQHAEHAVPILPDELLDNAAENEADLVGLTGGEPILHAEYLAELSTRTRQSNRALVCRSSGFMEPNAAKQLGSAVDAVLLDIPFFDRNKAEEAYRLSLQSVLHTLELLNSADVHLEASLLVPPEGLHDEHTARQLFSQLADISPELPLHLSFAEKSIGPTNQLWEVARQYIDYVYASPPVNASDTACPVCDTMLIRRTDDGAPAVNMRNNRCRKCNRVVYGSFPNA